MSEEEKTAEPTLHDKIEMELVRLRAHPDSASLTTAHVMRLLQLLADAVK